MLARALQEILLRNIRLQRFSWDWPAGAVLRTPWGAVGKDPELPSGSSGPAVLSLRYLTSSRETQMDLAKAFQVRSPENRHTACSPATFHRNSFSAPRASSTAQHSDTLKSESLRYLELWEVIRSGQNTLASSFVHSFPLLALHNVHLFNGPPCDGISFICIYETVYTDAHTIAR